MSAIWTLIDLIAGRRSAGSVALADWPGVISAARAEALAGTLAHQLAGADGVPDAVAAMLADIQASAAVAQTQSLWEAHMARDALAPAGVRFVLMKGTAYAAAALPNAAGRQIGDLDIMVAHSDLDRAEAALLDAGWEWVKSDPYDDAYYRQHMHELPPLIHRDRDRMIDVHHSILPLTHRARPDPAAMLAEAVIMGDGWLVLSPADMAVHCAAHCMADGDLAGGLRNLWDMHRLIRHFGAADAGFEAELAARARQHGLAAPVARAQRLAAHLYGAVRAPLPAADRLFVRALTARDDWGAPTRPVTRQAFYVRSHGLRMPPMLLARHLWVKWRRGQSSD